MSSAKNVKKKPAWHKQTIMEVNAFSVNWCTTQTWDGEVIIALLFFKAPFIRICLRTIWTALFPDTYLAYSFSLSRSFLLSHLVIEVILAPHNKQHNIHSHVHTSHSLFFPLLFFFIAFITIWPTIHICVSVHQSPLICFVCVVQCCLKDCLAQRRQQVNTLWMNG